jgi:hypothetical protein
MDGGPLFVKASWQLFPPDQEPLMVAGPYPESWPWRGCKAMTFHRFWVSCRMLRLVIRLLGFLALAMGMAVGVYDGARIIADGAVSLTSLGAALMAAFPRLAAMIEPTAARTLHPLILDPVLVNILLLPAVLVLFAAGTLLLLIGRGQNGLAAGAL